MEYENYPAQVEQQEVAGGRPLSCPVCAGQKFHSEIARAQGLHGFSSHILDLYICTDCRYTFTFYSKDNGF